MTRHSSGLAKKVGLQFSFHEVLAGGEETPLVVICITRAFRGDSKNNVKRLRDKQGEHSPNLTAPSQGAGQLLATCRAA